MVLERYLNGITKLFLQSLLGGFCIGLGGTVYLRLLGAFPGSNVVGAILFSIGLFVVCTRGYALYTGRLCYILDNINKPAYILDVGSIWFGNFVGCALIALLVSMTTIFDQTGANAADLVAKKMDAPILSLFVLGILCNIFMFIAVDGYKNNPHQLGKYLAIFLGVSVFILSGTEHCVADMYYWCVSGELYRHPIESLVRILVITVGNLVGGLSFPLAEKYISKFGGN